MIFSDHDNGYVNTSNDNNSNANQRYDYAADDADTQHLINMLINNYTYYIIYNST